ncbi:MAG: tRNA (adenosine(37)-N6)-threonylcarbamoyltransferase complex dimerization subunit type 1 TsaB [Candidatus Omnitrophica bacterium]|nr:tRNA (adenosine(37)-N6)-threonylcarbamoyltransferase complex dimerization subunit type 1 TsaB [Candidatus Omnitrophota bacterium]
MRQETTNPVRSNPALSAKGRDAPAFRQGTSNGARTKVLAIDTSSKMLSVALGTSTMLSANPELVEWVGSPEVHFREYNLEAQRNTKDLLLPTIKKGLRALNYNLKDIDYFAVGLGPGSFTGLRIGLSTIKALSFALKKPVVATSSLDVIAYSALPYSKGYICVLVDAKRDMLYCALYKSKCTKLQRLSRYLLIGIEDLFNKIGSEEQIVFLGDGLLRYQEFIERRIKSGIILNENFYYPQAGNLLRIAQQLIQRKSFSDPFRLGPIYLYPKECQISPQSRHKALATRQSIVAGFAPESRHKALATRQSIMAGLAHPPVLMAEANPPIILAEKTDYTD